MYNDQPDNASPGSDYGHTKGVVAVGDTTSFWLVHSVPNFPSSSGSGKFFFPSTETDFGQVGIRYSISLLLMRVWPGRTSNSDWVLARCACGPPGCQTTEALKLTVMSHCRRALTDPWVCLDLFVHHNAEQ
jgi:hypothetical protein